MQESGLFKKHYPQLDLVRAVAITLTMLVHFSKRAFALPAESVLTRFFHWGWNGVTLFFVLSGFLIGGQLLEAASENRLDFKEFYMKRFWRIFPPYYFSLCVVLAIYFAGVAGFFKYAVTGAATASEVLRDSAYHVFYLQNYAPVGSNLLNGVYWSLAVEEQFYILAPFLIYLFSSAGSRIMLPGIVSLIILGSLSRLLLYSPYGNWTLDFLRPFHTRYDGLLFGVLAAHVFLRHRDRLLNSPRLRALIFSLAAASLLICLVYGGQEMGYFNACWQFTLTGLGFSALILWVMVSFPGRRLRHTTIGYVAKISYSMYLYHVLLIAPVAIIAESISYDKKSPAHFLMFFSLYYFAVLFVSGAVYRLIDKPCLDYRKRLLEKSARSNLRPDSPCA